MWFLGKQTLGGKGWINTSCVVFGEAELGGKGWINTSCVVFAQRRHLLIVAMLNSFTFQRGWQEITGLVELSFFILSFPLVPVISHLLNNLNLLQTTQIKSPNVSIVKYIYAQIRLEGVFNTRLCLLLVSSIRLISVGRLPT